MVNRILNGNNFYCPGKDAAMGIIVVSLPCTAYQCGSLIAFCKLALYDPSNTIFHQKIIN